MSPGKVEAWLTRRPGSEDLRAWAAARLTAAEAVRLRAETAYGGALLLLLRRDRLAASVRLRFAGALGAVGARDSRQRRVRQPLSRLRFNGALGAVGARQPALGAPAEDLPTPAQGGG